MLQHGKACKRHHLNTLVDDTAGKAYWWYDTASQEYMGGVRHLAAAGLGGGFAIAVCACDEVEALQAA